MLPVLFPKTLTISFGVSDIVIEVPEPLSSFVSVVIPVPLLEAGISKLATVSQTLPPPASFVSADAIRSSKFIPFSDRVSPKSNFKLASLALIAASPCIVVLSMSLI